MSDHEPLDPALAALFRAEPAHVPPPEAQARVLERLAASMPMVPSPLGGGAGAPLAHASALGARMVGALAATFVAGAVVGGVAVSVAHPAAPERVVYVDRAVAASSVSNANTPSVPASATSPAPTPIPAIAPVAVPEAHAAPASSSPDGLTAERAVLDDARARLAGGDAAAAITQLQAHARRYPHGQLAEEREALYVEALVQTGHFDAARARAAQFRAHWPTSVLLPAVDATLQSIP